MRATYLSSLTAAVLLCLLSCHPGSEKPSTEEVITAGTTRGFIVADTIIYDVVIKSPDSDDAWAEERLRGLNYTVLIDSIFEMIYRGKAIAYNYETREKLTPVQVRKLETADNFSRDAIGMIQFTEVWYLDPLHGRMTKEVLSMIPGYNFYTAEGELFGHKPMFVVELK
jgi:hypothetical protein